MFVSWSATGRFERMKCVQSEESREPRRTIRDVTLRDLAGVNPLYFCKSYDLNFGLEHIQMRWKNKTLHTQKYS
jgi:hypothetical protein